MEVEGKKDYELDAEVFRVSISMGEKKSFRPHLAKTLEEHGVVEIIPITSTDIKKLIMQERTGPHLAALPDDFYDLVDHTRKIINDHKESERLRALTRQLIRGRVEKIHRSSLQPKTHINNLQPQERVFLMETTSLIGKFEKGLLGEDV